MTIFKTSALSLLLAAAVVSCQDQAEENSMELPMPEARYVALGDLEEGPNAQARLRERGLAIYSAEYLTSGESSEMGTIVYFTDRGNKQLGHDFAPGLSEDGTDHISYHVDRSRPSQHLPVAVTEAAIDRAMATWDGLLCSELSMAKVPEAGVSTGYIAYVFSQIFGQPFGGSPDFVAKVNHAGWLSRNFFDLLAPGGGDFILGVTFTIIYLDGSGNPVDVNKDGKIDVAWREIYYNDAFTWQDGSNYDVETVALHEAGHGLSQGHFGTAFRTLSNWKLHFAPRAVMNAAYSGLQTTIEQSDNAGHCSIWANWPNK